MVDTIDFQSEEAESGRPLSSPKIVNGLPQEHFGHLNSVKRSSGASNSFSQLSHLSFTGI